MAGPDIASLHSIASSARASKVGGTPLKPSPVVVGESITLAHPKGIRTWGEVGFKLSLWRFTFQTILNGRSTKLWGKMPSAGDKNAQASALEYSSVFRMANFVEGFAAFPPMEKAED
jgi:hypothetical protein